ncbi:MAG TPA: protein kinase, partial [Acidimicrobiia bacterium]|nr:protein kinase [Acidimicrobiia bacterium]
MSDLAGKVLAGRYLLQSAIGTGASGRVYVAEDTRLRRRVAVKVLHASLSDDNAFLRRFRAEAQLAASLHHPHIVTVHDWGEDDLPFMIL